MDKKQFECPGCGAQFEYDPAAQAARCPYCGNEARIEHSVQERVEAVREQDFFAALEQGENAAETQEVSEIACGACGAHFSLDSNVTSSACPFCGTQVVTQAKVERRIRPKALLPFKITRDAAVERWRKWLEGLWFAPNNLKRVVRHTDQLNGMYLPHWTYDCKTVARYRGERGDDYYEKDSNGNRVKRTRWHSVSGTVYNTFDDVLVLASETIPKKLSSELPPWDLDTLVPYSDAYLSGYRAEAYQKGLKEGFNEAKVTIDGVINETIRRDIGGDHQRIHWVDTEYHDITFKHILLPLWISAYRYNGKAYRFLVNGSTGKVAGERPYSWVKITLLILFLLAITGALVYYGSR